ncbi:hypothetical protein Moror_12590 [Moniliophthora roreri MCA 2997]|uniref:Uncharacterized protein n=2 Tax=Moniliophthora roreri TaxID=221103 RepID=V2X8Y9_MONRO|nr:hypothetical protein Moror_12590 [Moniliophthora roreri MCA 2997]KAI3621189.1 hypothetical protein WG66_014390 [Moniliophthora roreri]
MPNSPSTSLSRSDARVDQYDTFDHVQELAWKILGEAQNATNRKQDLKRLALEVFGVANSVKERIDAMMQEERVSLQCYLEELRGTMNSILIFIKGPIDESQFDVRMRGYKREFQNARRHFSLDSSFDRSLLRFSKLLDSFQLLLAPLQQWLVRFQPDRTGSAATNPRSPSQVFTPTSIRQAPVSQPSSPPELARRDDGGSSAQPLAHASEPHFFGILAPCQGHQHVTNYNTYNNCHFGSNTNIYGNGESSH